MMGNTWIRNPNSNAVLNTAQITAIEPWVNADNTYSFAYYTSASQTNPWYISTVTFPTQIAAIQAAYNLLVITLP